jgi:hypothetical protein
MANIHQAIADYLRNNRWAHEALLGQPAHRVFYQGENGRLICFAQAREEEQQFIFYSYSLENVPAERRQAMAEFIARANYGIVLGNFEIDFSDGEVRFKTSIDVEGSELTPALIEPVMYANVLTMDEYLPGLLAVSQGTATPEEAVNQIINK